MCVYRNWFDCGLTLIFCAFWMRNLFEQKRNKQNPQTHTYTFTNTHTYQIEQMNIWTDFWRMVFVRERAFSKKKKFRFKFLFFLFNTHNTFCDDDDCLYSKVTGLYSVSSLSLYLFLFTFFWNRFRSDMFLNFYGIKPWILITATKILMNSCRKKNY